MLTSNRRLAYFILWILNHTPGLRGKYEVATITLEFDPRVEAEWSPEERLRLEEILRGEHE